MNLKISCFILTLFFIFSTISCKEKNAELTCNVSQYSQKAISHLQPLIVALEKYKMENGRYPPYFNDLVPKYTQKIPMIGNEKITPGSPIFNHLVDKKLGDSLANIADDGNSYYIYFTTKDDRICLLGGRNNICEYSSENPVWNCHQ